MKRINDFKLYFILFLPLLTIIGCLTARKTESNPTLINTSPANGIQDIEIEFQKGNAFNHPSFAIWAEDVEGNFIETLYATKYVATGQFRYSELDAGKWKNEPGEARRPATLPYWAHKRNIKAPDGLYIPSSETAVPDALTSATPKTSFTLHTSSSYSDKNKFNILFEINQAWDSNEFWTNSKFADDPNYYTSLQPALVYSVTVDRNEKTKEYHMNPIGHSHPTGANGDLFTDITTLTSAKDIAHKIIVRLK